MRCHDPTWVTTFVSGLLAPTANTSTCVLCTTSLLLAWAPRIPHSLQLPYHPHLQPAIHKPSSLSSVPHYDTPAWKWRHVIAYKALNSRISLCVFITVQLNAMNMEVKDSCKRHYISIILHGVTCRRTVIFNKTCSLTESLEGRGQNLINYKTKNIVCPSIQFIYHTVPKWCVQCG